MAKIERWIAIACLVAAGIVTLSWQKVTCDNTADVAIASNTNLPESGYLWQNVAVGGAGFVTGIVIHPKDPSTIYIRTDVGGAYRWHGAEERWIPLMEGFSEDESHLYGVASLALDPDDSQRVYAVVGEYTDERARGQKGVVLTSDDRGETWRQFPLPFFVGSNELWRWNGERLAVDPHQSNLLYLGSRHEGLWKSTDRGATWQRVGGVPSGTANRGVAFVAFDPIAGSEGEPTRRIYAGVAGKGVYRSEDAGRTWQLLPTEETDPQRGVVASDGTLYVTFDQPGTVRKWQNNRWIEISPDPSVESYNAIAVDPNDPQVAIAAEWFFNHGNRLFRTTDGGETWREIEYKRADTVPWQDDDERFWAAGIASVAIAPDDPERVWYTDGWGVWQTDDISARRSLWRRVVRGYEEIVNFTLKSQPNTGALLQGSGDIGGMRHGNLNRYPSKLFQDPSWMASDFVSIAASEKDPKFVVAVGGRRWTSDQLPTPGYALYSTDDGQSWREFPGYPEGDRQAVRGRVAVSATDRDRIVWLPEGSDRLPYTSADGGQTWTVSKGAPGGMVVSIWQWNQPLASDAVEGNTFYLYDGGKVYRSSDGGLTWAATAAELPKLSMDWQKGTWSLLKTPPGMAGELWASFDTDGLYRSRDRGETFTRIESVQRAHLFAFGRNAPDRDRPSLFVYGTVNAEAGIFRSDDFGETWQKIDVPGQAIGKDPRTMEGDREVFGRVYIGTGGRGIYYGQPVGTRGEAQPADTTLFTCGMRWISSQWR